MLRIRDIYPGSEFFDPKSEFFYPGSEFFHPGSRNHIKELLHKKLFRSSRKNDPRCSSWIRILNFYPSRIPDPGVRKATESGSAPLILAFDICKLRHLPCSLYIYGTDAAFMPSLHPSCLLISMPACPPAYQLAYLNARLYAPLSGYFPVCSPCMPGLDLTSKTVYVWVCPNISLCLFLFLSNYVT